MCNMISASLDVTFLPAADHRIEIVARQCVPGDSAVTTQRVLDTCLVLGHFCLASLQNCASCHFWDLKSVCRVLRLGPFVHWWQLF